VGILTTAEKKGILNLDHRQLASKQMMQLNKVGEALGTLEGVTAITDVTGFGLLGHLVEMAEGSNLSAEIFFEKIPLITEHLTYYIDQKSVPGGTTRNWDSYGHKIAGADKYVQAILADPQTSGGLLVAVDLSASADAEAVFKEFGLEKHLTPIGRMVEKQDFIISVK
jgi:selenide,water dikinase